MLKFTKELHKTITYKPDCIAYMVSLIKDEYKNKIKQASLSTIINSGLNYQRTISYSKLKNQYQITKSMKKYYEGWNVNLNSKDKIGRTPLMIGVQRNRVNIVKILLESGANMKIKDNQGDDVFCYAKDYSNKEMWDVLQEYNKKKKQSVGFNFLGLRERLC